MNIVAAIIAARKTYEELTKKKGSKKKIKRAPLASERKRKPNVTINPLDLKE